MQNLKVVKNLEQMGQGIQEWTKYNLWKTAFKNLKGYGLRQIGPYHRMPSLPIFLTCIYKRETNLFFETTITEPTSVVTAPSFHKSSYIFDVYSRKPSWTSHQRCSLKEVFFKTPVSEYLFNKALGLSACNFIKKRLEQRCFPVNL